MPNGHRSDSFRPLIVWHNSKCGWHKSKWRLRALSLHFRIKIPYMLPFLISSFISDCRTLISNVEHFKMRAKFNSSLSLTSHNTLRDWLSTHWGRVTHICVSKLTIIGSDNGLSPARRQAIIWTNAGILLIGALGTNVSEIFYKICTFSLKKMPLKMSSGKRRPSCLGLNVFKDCSIFFSLIIRSSRYGNNDMSYLLQNDILDGNKCITFHIDGYGVTTMYSVDAMTEKYMISTADRMCFAPLLIYRKSVGLISDPRAVVYSPHQAIKSWSACQLLWHCA